MSFQIHGAKCTIFFVMVLLFSVAFMGCEDDSSPTGPRVPPPGEMGCVPLTVGNQWVFEFAVNETVIGEAKWEVISTSSIDDENWFQIQFTIDVGDSTIDSETQYLTNRDGSGVYHKDTPTDAVDMWWKYPCEVDDNWATEDGIRLVYDMDVAFAVPAGTISGCIVYGIIEEGVVSVEVIKPGEGLVAAAIQDGDDTITFELKSKIIL